MSFLSSMFIENGGRLQMLNSVTSKWDEISPYLGEKMPKIKPEISTQTTFQTPCVELQTFLTMTGTYNINKCAITCMFFYLFTVISKVIYK